MLSKKELSEKKKYIIERLKGKNQALDEERLKTTLLSLMLIESENDQLKNIRLYNLINTLSKGKLTLSKDRKIASFYPSLDKQFKTRIDRNYLAFLIQLAKNVSLMQVEYDDEELKPLKITDEDKINLSRKFYIWLGNKSINEKAKKILSDPTHFGFTDTVTKGNELLYGMTIYDTVFKKPYISIQRLGNIMGCQAFNHEIMHGIDFYFHPDIVNSQRYYGFHEVPTYTIDYLYLDFLDEMGFDKEQVDALRRKKQQYTSLMAKYEILEEIHHRLVRKVGINKSRNPDIDDIASVLDDDIIKDLLELHSCVIAHGLYEQICKDKEQGLANLQLFMNTILSPHEIPDFSFIGLDNQTLLQISSDMGKLIEKHETLKK